jgi:hypothetical protein
MKKIVGIHDIDIVKTEFCSITDTSKILGIHYNTVNRWIKKGLLQAAHTGVTRESILNTLEGWRQSTAAASTLTENELNSAISSLAEIFKVSTDRIGAAIEELINYHHISLVKHDKCNDYVILVHRSSTYPADPIAKIIKWMLADESYRRECYLCGKKLPRVTEFAESQFHSHKWTIDSTHVLDGYPRISIVTWGHWCDGCEEPTKFIWVERE